MIDLDSVLGKLDTKIQHLPEVKTYLTLQFIRKTELLISEKYSDQYFRCPVHLSVGQEAIAVGVSSHLSQFDKVVSTHRSHAHYIAKGGSIKKMLLEVLGDTQGCCGGRGGSMHIFDKSVGFIASIPIVGSSTPIAIGLALAEKRKHTQNIVVSYVGDAILETGSFYESMNLASLLNIPLLVVIEDNGFSTYADKISRVPAKRNDRGLIKSFGVNYLESNGDDIDSVAEITQEAVGLVRNFQPTVINFNTFRRFEHCGPNLDDHLGYRTQTELNSYKSRDPVLRYVKQLLEEKVLGQLDLIAIDEEVDRYLNSLYETCKESHLRGLFDSMASEGKE